MYGESDRISALERTVDSISIAKVSLFEFINILKDRPKEIESVVLFLTNSNIDSRDEDYYS